MNKPNLLKGTRVLPSGVGRTANWPKVPGTVTRALTPNSVGVVWDEASFTEDEMDFEEITLIEEEEEDELGGENSKGYPATSQRATWTDHGPGDTA